MDFSNIGGYEDFLTALQNVFRGVYHVLKPSHHCIVVVMDIRKGPNLFQFHSDVTRKFEAIGFTLKDIIQRLEEVSGKKIRAVYNKNEEPRLYLCGPHYFRPIQKAGFSRYFRRYLR